MYKLKNLIDLDPFCAVTGFNCTVLLLHRALLFDLDFLIWSKYTAVVGDHRPKNRQDLGDRLEERWMDALNADYSQNCYMAAWDRLLKLNLVTAHKESRLIKTSSSYTSLMSRSRFFLFY